MNTTKKTSAVLDAFVNYLHGSNKRITPERLSILEVIARQNKAFTIEDLREKMQKEAFAVSVATLYNTVELLQAAKLLKCVRLPYSVSTLYRIDFNDMPRVYLLCEECGRIKEATAKELNRYIGKYVFPRFQQSSFTLSISGICAKCMKLRNNNQQ